MKPRKNLPASVRKRLLNHAKAGKRPFNEFLQYYAMERFLYRLSRSPHASRFILKGALALRAWKLPELRPTMDIDMLGKTNSKESEIIDKIKDILATEVEADGLVFDPNSIQTEAITENADYGGIRIRFRGSMDSARVNMQIDLGFGDIVYPHPEEADFPTMLESPAPRLLCYSRESVISEKFEAMIKLNVLNSRMKDFHDIRLLSQRFDFDGADLAKALQLTFEQRKTKLPSEIEAFTDSFIEAKQTQWKAFRNRLLQNDTPESFREVVADVERFIAPPVFAIAGGEPFLSLWKAPGPWLATA